MAGNGVILYDANGYPASAAQNANLASPQAGIVTAGSDYAATPKAQVAKIDGSGSQYVVSTTPTGTSTMVSTGQAAGAAATQYGGLIMGRMDNPAPSTFNPLTLDQVGALQTHLKSKVTFTALAMNVVCGTNNILFGLQNASTMVLRLSKCMVYIPPAGGSGGALLGSSSGQTYYPVFCEMRRAATLTGGTQVAVNPSDSQDVLASGVTAVKAATGVTGTAVTFYQGDAYATNLTGIPFYERGADANAKTFLIRPGEAVYIVCTSSGTINNSTAGGSPVTAQANILAIFTQAVA